MRVECLPAASVPRLTKLYSDYLAKSSSVSKFYAPLNAASSKHEYPDDRCKAVAEVLLRQNKGWGASAETLKNVERLRNGASAIVTGQQVALFGGPMFAILKALTAIKQAETLAKSGVDCVPIFWLASEDHDLAEVSSVRLLDRSGALRNVAISPEAKEGAPVGQVTLGKGITRLVADAAGTFADNEVAQLLRDCYQPGETFTSSFARLFVRLFGEFGLILIDPSDPKLHEIGAPLLKQAAETASELNSDLLARGKELEGAGYHVQVKVTPSSTVLFALQDGTRTSVHRTNGHFSIGKERLDAKQLTARIESQPEQFSGNALFRPLIQDYLLPTEAYVGGPAEVAYFAQSEVLYRRLLGQVTPILSRTSATLIDSKIGRLLKKYHLPVEQTFISADELERKLASAGLPTSLRSRFETTRSELAKQLDLLSSDLKTLDPTLMEAATRAASKMKYQLSRLERRAGQAEARKNSDINRHAAMLSNSLYPHRDLQERGIAGISFVAQQGIGFLRQMYESLDLDCVGHQLLYP